MGRIMTMGEILVEIMATEAGQSFRAPAAILGRTAAYRGREYAWDEMIRENETLKM